MVPVVPSLIIARRTDRPVLGAFIRYVETATGAPKPSQPATSIYSASRNPVRRPEKKVCHSSVRSAERWPPGWAVRQVRRLGLGMAALGLARAQPVDVAAAGDTVLAPGRCRSSGPAAVFSGGFSVTPRINTPARIRLEQTCTQRWQAHQEMQVESAPHGRTSATHESSIVMRWSADEAATLAPV